MFEQKMLFCKLFSSFKIMGAIKDVNIFFESFETLNLNILASSQNIKNLVGNFWAIYVGNMHVNFQVPSSTDVEGEWGEIRKDGRHTIFGPIPVQNYHSWQILALTNKLFSKHYTHLKEYCSVNSLIQLST